MPISPNFTSILSLDFEINFLQCNAKGILKYTELFNFFQLTAAKHSELGAISFTEMQIHNQAWVLNKIRLEISKLPKWKQTVTIKTWIKSLENSRSIRCIEMYLDEEKIAACETFWVVMNTNSRRPEALKIAHEHFEKFPNQIATTKELSRIFEPENSELIATRTVVNSDIDIVNHVNSMKYLEWVLDTFDSETTTNQTIKSIEINYLKEVSLGEEVEICSNDNVFSLKKENKTCTLLEFDF